MTDCFKTMGFKDLFLKNINNLTLFKFKSCFLESNLKIMRFVSSFKFFNLSLRTINAIASCSEAIV